MLHSEIEFPMRQLGNCLFQHVRRMLGALGVKLPSVVLHRNQGRSIEVHR